MSLSVENFDAATLAICCFRLFFFINYTIVITLCKRYVSLPSLDSELTNGRIYSAFFVITSLSCLESRL